MRLLDRTLPTIAENLALDEHLLLEVEGGAAEVLRFWEAREPVVVLGASCRLAETLAEGTEIAVARRSSGGGAVVLGPGCLVVTLVLSLETRPALRDVRASFAAIGSRLASAVGAACVEGDLVVGDRKVSGSAQRRLSRTLLHHATLLDAMDLTLLSALREPARRPAYRGQRTHADFVANLGLGMGTLRAAAASAWGAVGGETVGMPDEALVARFADEGYVRRR